MIYHTNTYTFIIQHAYIDQSCYARKQFVKTQDTTHPDTYN